MEAIQDKTIIIEPIETNSTNVIDNVIDTNVIDIEPKKKNIRGKHKNHKTNEAYVGLTDEAKRKAITRNYYDKKGKLIYAIKNRVSKYGMDKDLFKECKTIEEVNVKVGEYLLTKGFTEENVKRMINRPTNYNK